MNNIKKLRENKGIQQRKLADYLNVAQGTLSYWERGKYDIDNKSLLKLAEYFNTSTDHILGKDDIPNPQPTVKLGDDIEYGLLDGYRKLKDEDRALINSLMERMLGESE